MHIYMSVGKRSESGLMLDPNVNPPIPTSLMNYRGESIGEHDDPVSFAHRMDQRGHAVHCTDKPLTPGTMVNINGYGTFMINYPKAFAPQMADIMKAAGA